MVVRQFIALLAVHFAIMPAGDSAVHPPPVHRQLRARQQVHAHELWHGVQVEHKHREAVVQVVVLAEDSEVQSVLAAEGIHVETPTQVFSRLIPC